MTNIRTANRLVPEVMVNATALVFAASLMATGAAVDADERRRIAEDDAEAFVRKLAEMGG